MTTESSPHIAPDNRPASAESPLMTAEELGRYLRLTDNPQAGAAANAVNQRLRRGQDMPPSIYLANSKRRLWHRKRVDAWILRDRPT